MIMDMKSKLIAGTVGVLALSCLIWILHAGNEKYTRDVYEGFKEKLGIVDTLQEGKVSFGFFSGELTVEDPELRGSPSSRNSGEFASVLSMLGKGADEVDRQVMMGFSGLIKSSINRGNSIAIKANKIIFSGEGDSEDGSLTLKIEGIDLGMPYLAKVAGDIVSVKDVSEEMKSPTDAERLAAANSIQRNGWSKNAVNDLSVTGGWIIEAVGLYGATQDINLFVERDSSGDGKLVMDVIHRVDGKEVGSIKRTMIVAEMPEIDAVLSLFINSVKSLVASNVGMDVVAASGLANAFDGFARKSKAEHYSVVYAGYAAFEDDYKRGNFADFKAYCKEANLSLTGLVGDFDSDKDDSECGVAKALADGGKHSEAYIFNDEKSLYSELMVNRKFKVEFN
jgi:hypothetical protein